MMRADACVCLQAIQDPDVARKIRECLNLPARAPPLAPAVAVWFESDIDVVPVWPHAERIWELRHTMSTYDACYVAVAEACDCPLLTTDERLGRATGSRVPVIVA